MMPDTSKQQLDHTTARIVEELAAALLPHLKETVSAELARTISALPVNIDREVEKSLASLSRFQKLFEDMAGALDSAQSSVARLSGDLRPLSRTCEIMEAATERLEQLAVKPDKNNGTQVNEALIRSLEETLHDWGGILKANGLAHTKELKEFSAEVSEQVGWIKSNMPVFLEKELKKTLLPYIEESRAVAENVRTLDDRLTSLEKIGKIVLVEGIILIAVLVAAAVLYFM